MFAVCEGRPASPTRRRVAVAIRSHRHTVVTFASALVFAGTAVMGAPRTLHAAPGAVLSCPSPAPGNAVRWVGAGEQFATLAAAVMSSNPGDTICVQAGVYENDFTAIRKELTIVGVGGLAHLKQTTSDTDDGKAILTISANVTLKSIEFSGATVPHANGAGIRWEGGNLTIEQSYFHDNQNGILGGGNVITIKTSKFVNNGLGERGRTHAMYVFGNETVVDGSYFDSTTTGHHVKSLAPLTTVTNSTFEDGIGNGKKASYSIDLQNGGVGIIRNNTFIQRPDGENAAIINHGDLGKIYNTNSILIEGNTVRNQRSPGTLLQNGFLPAADAQIIDNRLVGVTTISSGPATIVGNVTSNAVQKSQTATDGIATLAIVDEFAGGLTFSGGALSPHGIQGNTGITMLGSTIYVANRYQGIGVLDRLTGTSTLYQGPQGIEALGNDGTHLLAGDFDTDTVLRMTTDRTVVGTIELQVTDRIGITGIDSDGTRMFVASYFDGDVHVFDMNGILQDLIETGLGGGVLSGLSYDRGDGTLWLTAGFGDGSIYHFDLLGNLLGSFNLYALDVTNSDVPQLFLRPSDQPMPAMADASVPAPGGIAIFGVAVGALLLRRRQAKAA